MHLLTGVINSGSIQRSSRKKPIGLLSDLSQGLEDEAVMPAAVLGQDPWEEPAIIMEENMSPPCLRPTMMNLAVVSSPRLLWNERSGILVSDWMPKVIPGYG